MGPTVNLADSLNGSFEAAGSIAVWINVRQLLKDKMIRGSRWEMMLFFTSWSAWNLYYYPHLGQWLSLAGGASLALANAVWTALAVYYIKKEAR